MTRTYTPPAVSVGDTLRCEARQTDVTVTGWTEGRVSWPIGTATPEYGSRAGCGPVLCGDLVIAVVLEAAVDVASIVGVNVHTVSMWRRALGVGKKPRGTTARRRAAALRHPDLIAKARARRTPKRDPVPRATRKKWTHWTEEEDAILLAAGSPSAAAPQLPKRSKRAIGLRLMRLRRQ